MWSTRLYNIGISDLRRYVVCIMLSLCTLPLSAQRSTAKLLDDVLMSKDINACKDLLKQITEEEISQMADSTLRDYYYLAAWNASEENRLEESIYYFVRIKDLCENKLGIQNNVFIYFEVIKAIGETYEDLGNNDEALLWYEEGLVKSLTYLKANDETLQSYFKEIRDNAADIFEQKGHSDMARYLRLEKPLDYKGSFDYAYDLLEQAISLNSESRGNEAIPLLDEAYDIFKNYGDDGKSMMQPLYREYLLSYANIGDTKQIDKLLKSRRNIMFLQDNGSYLTSDMGEVVAIFLLNHYNVKAAQKYYQYILKEYDPSNQDEANSVARLGKNLQYFAQVYTQIDSLEQVRQSCVSKDYAWGVTSLQLANLLIKIQRYEDGNRICEEIYPVSSQLREDPSNLHWTVLMNLADYCILQKDYSNAERYMNEQLAWIKNQNISNKSEEGWVYNKIGIIYMNNGRYDESKKQFDKAETLLLPLFGKESTAYATLLHNRGRLAQLQGFLEEAKALLTEAKRIQILVSGKAMERTIQYLNEVEHAIKVSL